MRVAELAPKMVQLLREWAGSFPHDFHDETMMTALKDLTQRLAPVDQVRAPPTNPLTIHQVRAPPTNPLTIHQV